MVSLSNWIVSLLQARLVHVGSTGQVYATPLSVTRRPDPRSLVPGGTRGICVSAVPQKAVSMINVP